MKKTLLKTMVMAAIMLLTVCASLVSCSSDDDSSKDPGQSNSGESIVDNQGGKGFQIQQLGMKYVTFTISFTELKRLYLEGLGITYSANYDFSKLGIDENDLISVLREHVYLELSEQSDFNSVRGFSPEVSVENERIVYLFNGLYPDTKHYYRVYHLTQEGKHEYDQYDFRTKPFDESNLSINTGEATAKHHNLSYYNVDFGESTITINNIDYRDMQNIEYGIVPSFDSSELTPSRVGSLVSDRSNVSAGLTLKFMGKNGAWGNNQAVVKFTASALRKFEKPTLYYCIYVRLGTGYYLGDIKTLTLQQQ